ncbi:hypothetical protein DY000_02052357 [Brassica cretica]|uniref:Uncharacterized protein n=1 Tax=Brassica cretica TaxID=69181 RepID=A0ABQ7AG42_BRACR|nr:hypothetical protein DY000_02052357 [Brassica cretica]
MSCFCDKLKSHFTKKIEVTSFLSPLSSPFSLRDQPNFLDLSFSSDVRRHVRARAGVGGFPLSLLPFFSHLLHRRALYPLSLVHCSVPGVLSASSLHVRSSGIDVVQLGGGVTTRGDWKYSENLRSTIEEHRPCHFLSSTIGGVTKVVSEHGYTMLEWDLFQISTETSLNGLTVLTDVTIFMLEFATLMVGFTVVLLGDSNVMPSCCSFKVGVVCDQIQYDSNAHDHSDALILPASQLSVGGRDGLTVLQDDGSTRNIIFGMQNPEQNLAWPMFRELHKGFGSKLFGDERDELLVESQELLQRGEIELDRSQEFKK